MRALLIEAAAAATLPSPCVDCFEAHHLAAAFLLGANTAAVLLIALFLIPARRGLEFPEGAR